MMVKRKYKEEYLALGFVANGDRPQCVECSEVLSNESMKPSKLQRHLKTKHPELDGVSIEYFNIKKEQLHQQKLCLKTYVVSDKSTTKASYLVAQRIAKAKKPFTIAEELIGPCAVDMCNTVLGKQEASKIKTIPLSDNTIARRIDDLAGDIEEQLIDYIKSSPNYVLQMDESTDVSNNALLLVFVRYKGSNDLIEDMLTCCELPERTTALEIFNKIDIFITEKGLEWSNCVGVCTDGAAAMCGKRGGVTKLIRDKAPQANWTHCFLHRESLAAKDMSVAMDEVMQIVVKVINMIRKSALSSRLFKKLCEQNEAEYDKLLYFSAIRWLSRGESLKRLYHLRNEVKVFLVERKSELAEYFNDARFMAVLAYMTDIFSLLNNLNTSFQGKGKSVFELYDKIDAFKKKLQLWIRRVDEDVFDMFYEYDQMIAVDENANIKRVICEHLSKLLTRFNDYFPYDPREENMWIRFPFRVDVNSVSLATSQLEQLLEISSDSALKTVFMNEPSISKFWIHAHAHYPEKAV